MTLKGEWTYSDNAVAIYKRLYFDKLKEETKPNQTHSRIAKFIATNDAEAAKFYNLLEKKIFRPNSPCMINAGSDSKNPHDRALSACYVLGLEDSMDSIIEMWGVCAKIYASGAGSGIPITNLREKGATISTGGSASGPLAYLNVVDMLSNTVRSGGKCLAPYQPVFTNLGIKTVKELAEYKKEFVIISHDNNKKRMTAKKARAFKNGVKPIWILKTDKGEFHLSPDHPFKLADGSICKLQDLKSGMRLMACTTYLRPDGYIRINLKDGKKGKKLFHRMILDDAYEQNIDDKVIHHKDKNKLNNDYQNIELIKQSKHSYIHGKEDSIFHHQTFPKNGNLNGMHKDNKFWSNKNKVKKYKAKQKEILLANPKRPKKMQKLASRKRMLNTGYHLINSGFKIDTFKNYVNAYSDLHGSIGVSENKKLQSFINHFGSYENFYQKLADNNHIVQSITPYKRLSSVYAIEVDCDSPNDYSENDNHNFMIWDINNPNPSGSGIIVFNTRRAANMGIFKYNHPDIMEILDSKLNGEIQTFNLSMSVTDFFMKNLEKGRIKKIRLRSPNHKKKYSKSTSITKLWDKVITNAWTNGDPGLFFFDTVNKFNPTPSLGDIDCCNPCGEIALPPWSVCNIGSINISYFVNVDPTLKTMNNSFRWDDFIKVIPQCFKFLDNVIDKQEYIHPKFMKNAKDWRPVGLGIMGFADALIKLGIPYDSEEAKEFFEEICFQLTYNSIKQSIKMARDGEWAVPIPNEDQEHFYNLLKYYTQDKNNQLLADFEEYGIHNSNWTMIAPTGSTSMSADCSYAWEPLMALVWEKPLVESDEVLKIIHPQFEEDLNALIKNKQFRSIKNKEEIIEDIVNNNGSIQTIDYFPQHMKNIYKVAHDIDPIIKLKMQGAGQKWISMAISSTTNLPNSATIDDVDTIYKTAWEYGLKGITIFRDNCRENQVVQFGKKKIIKEKEIIKQRPIKREGSTVEIKTPHGKFYVTVNYHLDKPIEMFFSVGKQGGLVNVVIDALARICSKGLQAGMTMEWIVDTLEGLKGDIPFWFKIDDDVEKQEQAESIVDALAKVLQYHFMSKENNTQHNSLSNEIPYDKDKIDPAIYECDSPYASYSTIFERCPECNKKGLTHTTGCRGGECVFCGFSNCS